jgi:hypothetical protein
MWTADDILGGFDSARAEYADAIFLAPGVGDDIVFANVPRTVTVQSGQQELVPVMSQAAAARRAPSAGSVAPDGGVGVSDD